MAVQPVKLPRTQPDFGAELDQRAPARTDLPRRGVQRVSLAALEEVDLVRADHGQLKTGERVRQDDGRVSFTARSYNWLMTWTEAQIVSAPMAGTSSSSSVTARPLCRARRVSCSLLTHFCASILVIADIGQPVHWGRSALPT